MARARESLSRSLSTLPTPARLDAERPALIDPCRFPRDPRSNAHLAGGALLCCRTCSVSMRTPKCARECVFDVSLWGGGTSQNCMDRSTRSARVCAARYMIKGALGAKQTTTTRPPGFWPNARFLALRRSEIRARTFNFIRLCGRARSIAGSRGGLVLC